MAMASDRSDRFIETQPFTSSGGTPLNSFASFFAAAPSIPFRQALLQAGANADFIISHAQIVVNRAESNGRLAELGLSREEAMCIAGYSIEVPGGASMYSVLNRALRNTRNESSLECIRPLFVMFLKCLRKLPLVEVNELYRGVDGKIAVNSGSSTVWWAFTSTSTDADVMNAFAEQHGNNLIVLNGPCKGYDLRELSEYPHENELLLEPETHLKVNSVVRIGKGACAMCEIVPSEPVLLQIRDGVDAENLFKLGVSYLEGDGVEIDKNRAFSLFQRAAGMDHAGAINKLGVCYSKGNGVNVDNKMAFKLFERASEMNNVDAIRNLGVCYMNGLGVDIDKGKAIELYQRAAGANDSGAIKLLGVCYLTGDGVEANKSRAITFFKRASDLGDAAATFLLGQFYMEGNGVGMDKQEGIRLYRKAVEMGYGDAMTALGSCYGLGNGVEANMQKAFELYKKGSDIGNGESIHMLGLFYLQGEVVKTDKQKAFNLFKRSAEMGVSGAMYYLGLCYLYGEGVGVDETKGIRLIQNAADKGFQEARVFLARR